MMRLALALASLLVPTVQETPEALAKRWADAIRKVNEEHAAKPGKTKESELAKRLPKDASAALDKLLAHPDATSESLVEAGEAALDLDLMPAFEKIRARLAKLSPEHSLGTALSRDRYLLRAIGKFEAGYLEKFATVLDSILGAYDELFGFEEFSKVPGKKLRVRIHLEDEIKRPPHFAPQFPFHSEIDFPVVDPAEFKSPTAKGQFLFYGLCHELGHVIAMWGDRKNEEDRHAWAHYTGLAIVDHLSKKGLDQLRDVKWRSLEIERKKLAGKAASRNDQDGVMVTLIGLHDRVCSKAIGSAINLLDREDRRPRINRVRYYSFGILKEALLRTVKDPKARAAVADLIP
jgi:hypothetical protein